MFPSETYKELCIKNQKVLREKWEKRGPSLGDWVLRNKAVAIVTKVTERGGTFLATEDFHSPYEYRPSEAIPLFQPRQLIEMLEERGYDWLIESKALIGKEGRYEAVLFGLCTKRDTKIKLRAEGPDPATALLKAYLKVMKDDQGTDFGATESTTVHGLRRMQA